MHENKTSSTKRRIEILKSPGDFIDVQEHDYKWLLPLANKLVPKTEALMLNAFAIKDRVGDYITILRVVEEQIGQLRIWGYNPVTYSKKKTKVNPKDELPFFEMTIRFVLGKATMVSFTGNPNNKENIWNDVQARVLPVIKYLQYYSKKLTVDSKTSKVNGKKIQQNVYKMHCVENKVPTEFVFLGQKWKIAQTKLEKNEEKLLKDGTIAAIDSNKNAKELQRWATEMRMKSSMIPENRLDDYPLYDRRREKLAKINAISIEIDKNSPIQILVNRLDEETFQLDYYDVETEELQLIMLVNITNIPARYDIVYICGEGNITKTDEMYASRIANMFLDILIDMRIYSWEDAIDKDTGLYYKYYVYPMPDIQKEFADAKRKAEEKMKAEAKLKAQENSETEENFV